MTDDDPHAPGAAEPPWAALREALARAVRRQCPAWLRDHADDLVQAALLKIMAVSREGEGKTAFSSFYLYRVAHSALVDEIRRRQRRAEVALEVGDADDDRPGTVAPTAARTPEHDTALRELGAAVRACLLAMVRDRRLAVMLYLQGHSVPDAARVLGWPAKRTENLVYRGLADLRQCLLAKGHSP